MRIEEHSSLYGLVVLEVTVMINLCLVENVGFLGEFLELRLPKIAWDGQCIQMAVGSPVKHLKVTFLCPCLSVFLLVKSSWYKKINTSESQPLLGAGACISPSSKKLIPVALVHLRGTAVGAGVEQTGKCPLWRSGLCAVKEASVGHWPGIEVERSVRSWLLVSVLPAL